MKPATDSAGPLRDAVLWRMRVTPLRIWRPRELAEDLGVERSGASPARDRTATALDQLVRAGFIFRLEPGLFRFRLPGEATPHPGGPAAPQFGPEVELRLDELVASLRRLA